MDISNKILMVGAGPLQVEAIKKLKELNYYVVCVDYDENAVGFQFADKHYVVSTIDIDAVCDVARRESVANIITSTSDAPVRTVSFIRENLLHKAGLSYVDAKCATIKSEMRNRLRENNVPIPKFSVVNSYKEFVDAVHLYGLCIAKPSDNAGSRGVVLVKDTLGNDDILKTFEYVKGNSRNGIVMVEECMEGPEVSVEAITIEGETIFFSITDKLVCEKPFFVEIGHSEPSKLTPEMQTEIYNVALMAIKAIGINNGPSHTEIMVTEDGPKVVEIAARLGGDYITSKLVPLSTGEDIGEYALKSELGICENKPIITKHRGSCIRFLFSNRSGIVDDIQYDSEILGLSGVEEIVFYKKPGERCNQIKSSNDRIGHVITSGETNQDAIDLAEALINKIHIIVR